MSLSWGERGKIKEDLLAEMDSERGQILTDRRTNREANADFDSRTKIANAELDTRIAVFEAKQSAADELKTIENSNKAAEDLLAEKKREIANVGVENDKQDIMRREAELEKRLEEKDMAHEAAIGVVRAEAQAAGIANNNELTRQVARAEAVASAKDQIIESQKAEIARLDELLKVTMGKLTQVDLKGVTIHVEAAKPAGKDGGNSGKQEQKS